MRCAGAWLAGVALLGGCAVPRVPDVVSVPVPVACITAAPARPAIATDAELAALDDYDLVRRLAAERAELVAWLEEVQPLLAACASVPLAPSWSIRR